MENAHWSEDVELVAVTGYVDVRAYAELNDFLSAQSRGLTVRRPFRPHQTVKDVLEAMGIPHTEVDLVVVNGNAEDFAHRPASGDRIAVYPMFEALDIGSTARLRPVPLRDPRFVIDVNLGRLARLLRMLGFDVWWSSDGEDQGSGRRQSGPAPDPVDPRSCPFEAPRRHARPLRPLRASRGADARSDPAARSEATLAPFSRCVRCNGRLIGVSKAEVIDRLEPFTRRYYDEFSRCAECGRIYWPGSHRARLVGFVDAVRNQL